MIWTNMSLPSVNYRVQLCDTWAELDFERMDNPREGDKIVYRSLGEDNVPYISKTEVYSDGEWTEESGGSASVKVKAVFAGSPAEIYPEEFSPEFGAYMAEAPIAFPQTIPDIAIVSINGTEYTCEKIDVGVMETYGAPVVYDDNPHFDFSVYPFAVTDGALVLKEMPTEAVVCLLYSETDYSAAPPERVDIDSGTLIEDKDSEEYVAHINVSSLSELDGAYISITNKMGTETYSIDNNGIGWNFAIGYFYEVPGYFNVSCVYPGTFSIFKYEQANSGINWKKISVPNGMYVGGLIQYHSDGAVDEDGNALWIGGEGVPSAEIDIAEEGILTVVATPSSGNAVWNGSATVTNCNAFLLTQTNNASIIYRFYKVRNISDGATISCSATFGGVS